KLLESERLEPRPSPRRRAPRASACGYRRRSRSRATRDTQCHVETDPTASSIRLPALPRPFHPDGEPEAGERSADQERHHGDGGDAIAASVGPRGDEQQANGEEQSRDHERVARSIERAVWWPHGL